MLWSLISANLLEPDIFCGRNSSCTPVPDGHCRSLADILRKKKFEERKLNFRKNVSGSYSTNRGGILSVKNFDRLRSSAVFMIFFFAFRFTVLLLFVSPSLQTPLQARFHVRGCLYKSCCDVQLMDVNELSLSLVTGRTLLQLVKSFWFWIVFIPF